MVVDIGEVKRHIKPKADSTLRNMRKDDLIEYIRCLENNYNVAVSFNENQAKYIESLDAVEVVHGRMVEVTPDAECPWHKVWECSLCGNRGDVWYNYCPNCGAKMDGDVDG